MSKVVAEEQNCYLVSAENFQANPDGIHINAESQRQFGIRYYEAFSKKANVSQAIGDEDERLIINDLLKKMLKFLYNDFK